MKIKSDKNLLILILLVLLGQSAAGGATHKVAASETFYSISRKYGVSVSALMSFNKVKDPKTLRLGQRLQIPSKGSSPSSSKKSSSSTSSAAQTRKVTSKSMRIIIDPGHGGRDRGALWGGIAEADLNMRVARKAESYLKARGYGVSMTRRSDAFVTLSRRAEIANRYRNAVFVSIHFNASKYTSVRGAETFYAGDRGRYLASSIQRELVSKLKVRNRGIRYRRFAVLRQTACPAVLVECGFISNSYERSRCKTSSYQTLTAQAIVAGIERYDRAY